MAKAVSLDALIPKAASFKLQATNKTYHLRPFNLDDLAYLQRKFFGEKKPDDDEFGQRLSNMTGQEISEVVYHQMTQESKREFMAKQDEWIDDEGQLRTDTITGPKQLRSCVSYRELETMLKAYLQTYGFSQSIDSDVDLEVVDSKTGKKKLVKPLSKTKRKYVGAKSTT